MSKHYLMAKGKYMPQDASILHNNLSFNILHKGDQGGPTEEKCSEFKSLEDLKLFFDGKIPEDIGANYVGANGIGLGTRKTGGYGIEIESVTQQTGGATAGMVTVRYRESKPTGIVTQVLTTPYVIFGIIGAEYMTEVLFIRSDK
jgi:hypothetical protein